MTSVGGEPLHDGHLRSKEIEYRLAKVGLATAVVSLVGTAVAMFLFFSQMADMQAEIDRVEGILASTSQVAADLEVRVPAITEDVQNLTSTVDALDAPYLVSLFDDLNETASGYLTSLSDVGNVSARFSAAEAREVAVVQIGQDSLGGASVAFDEAALRPEVNTYRLLCHYTHLARLTPAAASFCQVEYTHVVAGQDAAAGKQYVRLEKNGQDSHTVAGTFISPQTFVKGSGGSRLVHLTTAFSPGGQCELAGTLFVCQALVLSLSI